MSFNSTAKELIEQNINGLLSIHNSWQRVPMDSIAKITNGFPFKSSEFNNRKDGVPLIRIRDVLKGNTSTYYSGKVPEGYWIYAEDLIVGMDGDFNTAIWRSEPALLNQRVCKIEINEENYDKRFLFHVLPGYLSAINANTSSVTVKHLSSKTLQDTLFPLPSLTEQKIIAEKLDTLMVQVDSIKAHLEKTLKILKRFRQAVLCAAMNGKLTEKWRDEKKIPFKSWEIKKANDLCIKVQSGSTPTGNPFAQNGTIPFLKVYNIVNQKIDFDYKPQYITDEVHRARSKRSIAIPDDVLMNIVGPPLGKVAILTEQYPEWNINQAITLFRVDKDKLLSGFLYHVLCEGGLVRDVMHETKGIVGQINISLTQCREALIPCPSLEEQHEIVRRVEQLFAYADTIEKQVDNALSRVNNLTQSILAKAFRGELTAQWRAENPELISGENSAAALLEKIKAERAASTGKKASRKKS